MTRPGLLSITAALAVFPALLASACGDDPIAGIHAADAADALVLDSAAPVDTTGDPDGVGPVDDASPDDTSGPDDTAAPEDATPPTDTGLTDTSPTDATSPTDTAPAGDTLEGLFADVREPFVPPPADAPAPAGCAEITNPGAESGDLTGWEVVQGSFFAQRETGLLAGNYPAPYAGTFYFRAGNSSVSRMQQDVDVSQLTAGDGPRFAVLSAQVRNRSGGDEPWLGLTALDSSGNVLGGHRGGPYARSAWHAGAATLELPPTTAVVRLELRGVRDGLIQNDAYFDDLSLCLYDRRPHAAPAELLAPPYLMNVTTDAVTVLFETRAPVVARVDYGHAPDALDAHVVDETPRTLHELRLTGLDAGTRAFYRVSWADMELPIYDLLTAPEPDDARRVELIMFADNQNGVDVFTELAVEMAAFDPDLLLHGGDAVQNGQRAEYREYFFGPLFGLGNHAAMLWAFGNHESYSSGIFPSSAARALWEEVVDQPGDERCFGVRWGPLFVLVLDTERDHQTGSAQYACAEAWLSSDAAQEATFRTALFHRPPLVEWWNSVPGLPATVAFFGGGMDAPDVRDHLAPLFEATGVHLAFSGHNHLYQYVPEWPATVAWVTAGGAGGALESGASNTRVNDWSDEVDTTIIGRHHFLRVVVEHDVMGVQAVALGGEILHTFYIWP